MLAPGKGPQGRSARESGRFLPRSHEPADHPHNPRTTHQNNQLPPSCHLPPPAGPATPPHFSLKFSPPLAAPPPFFVINPPPPARPPGPLPLCRSLLRVALQAKGARARGKRRGSRKKKNKKRNVDTKHGKRQTSREERGGQFSKRLLRCCSRGISRLQSLGCTHAFTAAGWAPGGTGVASAAGACFLAGSSRQVVFTYSARRQGVGKGGALH